MVATLQEVRRAIYWGERFLSKLYQEFTINGKTYGVIKDFPSASPLSLTLQKRPDPPSFLWVDRTYRNILLTGYACTAPAWGHCAQGPMWGPDATIETVSDTGETWEGRITFLYWFLYVPDMQTITSQEIAKFYVKYRPSPADQTKMRIEITVESARVDLTPSLYLNFTHTQGGTKCILPNISASDIGRTLTFDTESAGCFPSNTVGVCDLGATYWWFDSPAFRDRAAKIKAFIDWIGHPLREPHYRIESDLPDTPWRPIWLWEPGYSNWAAMPIAPGMSHYWSKAYFCDRATELLVNRVKSDIEWENILYLNRYKDPDRMVCTYNKQSPPIYNSVRGILRTGGTEFGTKAAVASLGGAAPLPTDMEPFCFKDKWVPGLGMHEEENFYRCLPLSAYTVLGYGFGDEEAKTIADDLAECMIKSQWGYEVIQGIAPSDQIGYHYTKEYGRINRPDLTGAFPVEYCVIEGESIKFATGYRPWADTLTAALMTFFNISGSPEEARNYVGGCASDRLAVTLNQLRVYEFYKWRLPR